MKSCRKHKKFFHLDNFYFPVTLSEAPSLKNSEDGFIKSFSETNAPDFIADKAIQYDPLPHKKHSNLYCKSNTI